MVACIKLNIVFARGGSDPTPPRRRRRRDSKDRSSFLGIIAMTVTLSIALGLMIYMYDEAHPMQPDKLA